MSYREEAEWKPVSYELRSFDYERNWDEYEKRKGSICTCKREAGSTKQYEIRYNEADPWKPICHCCDISWRYHGIAPKPNCQCSLHAPR